jgi:hypothetical protein
MANWFLNLFKEKISSILLSKGFVMTFDSDHSSSTDPDWPFQKIIYKKDNTTITIGQEDWRDSYFIYYIKENGNRVFEVNTTKEESIDSAINSAVAALNSVLSHY